MLEASAGCLLRTRAHFPPMMFNPEDVLALHICGRTAQATIGPLLGLAARPEIRAALGGALKAQVDPAPRKPSLGKVRSLTGGN